MTSGGVHMAVPLHWASQLASTLASAVHWPPVIDRPHCAEAPASPLRMPVMAVCAAMQAAETSLSSEPPPSGPMADQLSVAPRSVAMFTHAVRTLPSIVFATVTRSALACTNACAVPPSERLPNDAGN